MKFLRQSSQDSMSIQRTNSTDEVPPEKLEENNELDPDAALSTSMRKTPQKRTTAEKKIFLDTLEEHGE